MKKDETWLSRPKRLVLKFEYAQREGDVIIFQYRDKFNNVYKHSQVSPTVAASQGKATQFLLSMCKYELEPNQVVSDFTDVHHILDKFNQHAGELYYCDVRLRKMAGSDQIFRNVDVVHHVIDDDFLPKYFENQLPQMIAVESFDVDFAEMAKLQENKNKERRDERQK